MSLRSVVADYIYIYIYVLALSGLLLGALTQPSEPSFSCAGNVQTPLLLNGPEHFVTL